VTLYNLPAFAEVVAAAVAVDVGSALSCAVANKKKGIDAVAPGKYWLSSIMLTSTPGDVSAMIIFLLYDFEGYTLIVFSYYYLSCI
jgi:hypothetical protein